MRESELRIRSKSFALKVISICDNVDTKKAEVY